MTEKSRFVTTPLLQVVIGDAFRRGRSDPDVVALDRALVIFLGLAV